MKWKVALAALTVMLVFFIYQTIQEGKPNKPLLILGEDSSNLSAYRTLAEEFKLKYGIEVTFEAATFEQLEKRADTDFRRESGRYDIVLNYNFSLAPYVRSNYVLPLSSDRAPKAITTDSVGVEFFDNALRETSFYYGSANDPKTAPKQFGFPFAANTMMLVYRADLFESDDVKREFLRRNGRELEVPRDWNEYIQVAEFFSSYDKNLHGVVMQGAPGGWLYYEFANYLFSIGSGTSNKKYGWEESPIHLATDKNEQALTYAKMLLRYNAGDFYTVDAVQQRKIMLDGKAAMAIMWSDYIPDLVKVSNQERKYQFGYSTIPGGKSGLAGGAFYINAKSSNVNAASQFILYVMSNKVQERLIHLGLCSPVRSAYTSDVREKVPYAGALYESLDRGTFMFEAGTNSAIVSNSITTFVQKYMRGEIGARDALQLAEDEILRKTSATN